MPVSRPRILSKILLMHLRFLWHESFLHSLLVAIAVAVVRSLDVSSQGLKRLPSSSSPGIEVSIFTFPLVIALL
jgi:hypothetical protein